MRGPRPSRRPLLRALPLLVLPLALAACGGDDGGDGSSTTSTRAQATSTGAAPATTTATTPPSGDAEARVRASAAALKALKSYHVSGTQTDDDGRAVIEGDVTAAGRAALTYRVGRSEVEFRVLGSTAYVRGNAAYWRAAAGAQGATLAGRWIKGRAGDLGAVEVLDSLLPRTLARCLPVGNGTLRTGGTATVDGEPADVVIDAGDKPGTTPSRVFLAGDGPPLPLRVLQTGRRRPGGTLDPKCQDEDDTSTASDLRLSDFDEEVEIATPKDAIELPAGSAPGAPAPS
jgi:hypothetical protein